MQTVGILADVTYILKGLQKACKKTRMLCKLWKLKEKTIDLESLKDESLTGGWEMFTSKSDDDKSYSIQLDESR